MDGNRGIPVQLRFLLWLVNHFVWMTGRPLPAMRPRMRLFLRLMDRFATERARGAFTVRDETVPASDGYEIPIRLYIPRTPGPLPMLVYYHGGGFALGSHTVRDRFNRTLAEKSGTVLVSVGYRLAPEHPYPRGVEDAYDALRWCAEHAASFGGDPARIAVAGESAGGNLAAVVALMARDRGGPRLRCQALLYPAVDLTGHQPSVFENGSGYMLTIRLMKQFVQGYVPDKERRRQPYASPLFAERLEGLPPAVIVTAQFCPLRDQGKQYAQRLRQAGVPAVYRCYAGMIHDFTAMMSRILGSAKNSLHLAAMFIRNAVRAD
ncbi:alpha/beta hydrolase [Paenibacillus beijingensis]|nr:alpha/beta hydrolase [Paenibacillus beijingensis]